ncbi:alpha-amylase family glycosyl hydrolase [Allokutzneria albata]|uniref:alpha-amylase family glycosyl hydrolase n=1 Tax=Allokutzneria albata TaxID=211114 RepID=UPI0018D4B556
MSKLRNALGEESWPNYVLSNHDRPRPATSNDPNSVRLAAMLLRTLRGTQTLYYGNELGLPGNVADQLTDADSVLNLYRSSSKSAGTTTSCYSAASWPSQIFPLTAWDTRGSMRPPWSSTSAQPDSGRSATSRRPSRVHFGQTARCLHLDMELCPYEGVHVELV